VLSIADNYPRDNMTIGMSAETEEMAWSGHAGALSALEDRRKIGLIAATQAQSLSLVRHKSMYVDGSQPFQFMQRIEVD
jgi:hypothetical protein